MSGKRSVIYVESFLESRTLFQITESTKENDILTWCRNTRSNQKNIWRFTIPNRIIPYSTFWAGTVHLVWDRKCWAYGCCQSGCNPGTGGGRTRHTSLLYVTLRPSAFGQLIFLGSPYSRRGVQVNFSLKKSERGYCHPLWPSFLNRSRMGAVKTCSP